MPQFKRAFTPKAVREIYEALLETWPNSGDLERVLKSEARSTTGLYIGNYDPGSVATAVTRHCLYADKIILADPFPFPTALRDEYSPLCFPERYRAATLQWFILWWSLLPWIDAGLVAFVRTPGDFDPALSLQLGNVGEERMKAHPELEVLARSDIDNSPTFDVLHRMMKLQMPDSQIRDEFRAKDPEITDAMLDECMKVIAGWRAEHPLIMDTIPDSSGRMVEMVHTSSGASYEMAKVMARLSGSYLVTDLEMRWREMSIDRETSGVDGAKWSPFAKAFQELPFKYLDNVPLDVAFKLRTEGKLEGLRAFLRKAWRSSVTSDPYSRENVENLAAELTQRVNDAEADWSAIHGDLLQWTGTSFAGSIAASGILTGKADWMAAAGAAAAAGAVSLARTSGKRREFHLKQPAGFFMNLKRQGERRSR